MLPILRQTLANYARLGAPELVQWSHRARGCRRRCRSISGYCEEFRGAREVYVALARAALRDLPAKNRAALEKILKAERRQDERLIMS